MFWYLNLTFMRKIDATSAPYRWELVLTCLLLKHQLVWVCIIFSNISFSLWFCNVHFLSTKLCKSVLFLWAQRHDCTPVDRKDLWLAAHRMAVRQWGGDLSSQWDSSDTTKWRFVVEGWSYHQYHHPYSAIISLI